MLKGLLSYWMLPLFSAVVWLAMLLAMLLHWVLQGKPIYESMARGQTIAYISDVGAEDFKPLFITMGTISVLTFDLAFIAERWLRHTRRLVHNTSRSQKTLAALSIVFSIIGGAGLVLLTIFDTKRHKALHDTFLSLFIGGYVISAIFTCAEYQRLGVYFREIRILRISFWMKLFFILVEIALAIAFGALNRTHRWNAGAIVEWVIALIYSIYVLSFVVDFLPATHTKHGPLVGAQQQQQQQQLNMEELGIASTNGVNGVAGVPVAGTGRTGVVHDADDDAGLGRYSRGGAASPGRFSGAWFGRKEQVPRGMV